MPALAVKHQPNNCADGVLQAARPAHAPTAAVQVQVPSGKAVKPPASMAISKPRGGLAGHNSSMPATPRSVELGSSPVPGPLHMMNGSADGSFSPTTYGMASQPQHSMPFSSPIQPKVIVLTASSASDREILRMGVHMNCQLFKLLVQLHRRPVSSDLLFPRCRNQSPMVLRTAPDWTTLRTWVSLMTC